MMAAVPIWKMINDVADLPSQTRDEIFRIKPHDAILYTSMDVLNEIQLNYSSYKLHVPYGHNDNVGLFILIWSHYNSLHQEQLFRMYEAITADYDPISNYDMTESSADGKKISKETTTNTPTGGTETTTQLNRYGLNSGASGEPSDTSTSTVHPLEGTKSETTREYQHDKSMDYDGSTLSGFHETHEHYMQRKGNIGVMTAADMILREQSVRKIELLRDYIKHFIDTYAYTIGGDDE